ncbi:MAG: hypothetical protein GWO11_00655 [Desulfuromonadales bacterium]|nr:hypothetical protein [Desulfuromonadales bacterium]NIR33030.1 hypothetical protein [Desulfuromonadales bacterium]NIS39273.1 hypothetical protein [Desulfuromonadales bacterium]
MRKLLVVVAAVLLMPVTHGFAAPIGPLWTQEGTGPFVGLGYSYVDADWEPSVTGASFGGGGEFETQQNQFQLHFGLNFAKGWTVFAGGGLSTLNAEHAFRTSDEDAEAGTDFDTDDLGDDLFPFGTAGISGLLSDGKTLDVGFFAQVSYQTEFEDELVNVSAGVIEEVEFEMEWDGVVGLLFQGELEGAYLYGGPIVYTSKATARRTESSLADGSLLAAESTSVEESENLGAVAGVRWELKEGTFLDFELQKRSQVNIGLALNKMF